MEDLRGDKTEEIIDKIVNYKRRIFINLLENKMKNLMPTIGAAMG